MHYKPGTRHARGEWEGIILGALNLEYAAFAAAFVSGYPRWMRLNRVSDKWHGSKLHLREAQYRYICIPEIEHQYVGASERCVVVLACRRLTPVIGSNRIRRGFKIARYCGCADTTKTTKTFMPQASCPCVDYRF